MKYIYDNDLHIHSFLSSCSQVPAQNPERILQYAVDNNLNTICLTDHFWDEAIPGASDWYSDQDYPHICESKPLPQKEGIKFLFGCEAEMDKNYTLGLSKKVIDELDFIVVPTTHFHMIGFTLTDEQRESSVTRAKAWVDRFESLISRDLPYKKMGVAHLTCTCIAPSRELYLETINRISKDEMYRLFKKASEVGIGIELNQDDIEACKGNNEELEIVLKPFTFAKECGCKFYCGSDAHSPDVFKTSAESFQKAIDLLELEETDKFHVQLK